MSKKKRQHIRSKVYCVSDVPDTIFDVPKSNRPFKRGDCPVRRPCKYVSCKHHLLLDVLENGNIKVNFPEVLDTFDFTIMPETCGIDVSNRGESTLKEISEYLNITRERVRQIEAKALKKYKKNAIDMGISPDIFPDIHLEKLV